MWSPGRCPCSVIKRLLGGRHWWWRFGEVGGAGGQVLFNLQRLRHKPIGGASGGSRCFFPTSLGHQMTPRNVKAFLSFPSGCSAHSPPGHVCVFFSFLRSLSLCSNVLPCPPRLGNHLSRRCPVNLLRYCACKTLISTWS